MAATHVNHMQKALDQMHVQLHHVISDITGQTGLAIVDAILAGERDPFVLAKLRNDRIKAGEDVIAKSLVAIIGPSTYSLCDNRWLRIAVTRSSLMTVMARFGNRWNS